MRRAGIKNCGAPRAVDRVDFPFLHGRRHRQRAGTVYLINLPIWNRTLCQARRVAQVGAGLDPVGAIRLVITCFAHDVPDFAAVIRGIDGRPVSFL